MAQVISLLRRVDARTWAMFLGCFAMYYVVYARYYTSGEIVHCCDTHGMWTIEYLAMYSIVKTSQFAWWDPTGVNGWPIYSNLLNWTFNYFSPYALPYISGLWVVTRFFEISPQGINKVLVFQKVIYFFVLNFIAVLLISREMLKTYTARALVAITFTLGVIQFQGFRDSHQYMALPGPLFYIWSLLYYDRLRSLRSFFVVVLTAGLLAASLSYAFTQSGFYWTVAFTIFLLVFHPDLVISVRQHLKEAWYSRIGRACLISGILLCLVGAAAPLSSVALNVGHLMRVTGSKPLNWAHGMFSDWDPPYFGVPSYELWTNVMYFAARSEIHNLVLTFDPWKNTGIDQRYVGLAILPLLVAALVTAFRHRYFGPLFLTFFICVIFIPYTIDNLAYFSLMHLQAFQNVRTVGGLMPRDGPALFLILIAAIALDRLVIDGHSAAGSRRSTEAKAFAYILTACLAVLLIFAVILFALGMSPKLLPLRNVLVYSGFCLGLFCILVLLLQYTENAAGKRTLCIVLLVLVISDLILSGSHYFMKRPNHNNMIYRDVPGSSWAKPRPKELGPVSSEAESWAGPDYRGILHNLAGGPWVGLREWLILEGRPAMSTLLENWNRETKFMRAYPHFRFYSAGRFIPYDKIKTIDGLEVPKRAGEWVYVHDARLAEPDGKGIPIEAQWKVEEFGLNGVRVRVSMPQAGIMVYFDNYDPYWRAYVENERVPIHRANFTFKALKLSAGDHVVEWTFNPWPVKLAWAIFYVVLLTYCYLMWRCFRRPHFTGDAR